MPRFYSDISGAVAGVKQTFMLDIGDETTNLTTGTAKKTFRFPYDFNIDDIRVNVNTAPVGSTIIVDVNLGGTSIFNAAKLSIDASEETSKTAAAAYSLKTSAIDSDDEITVDIDQIGSSTAGKGLKLIIVGTERTSEPTYTLSCNVTDVDEGSAAVFTLNTKNVADTTTVPWVISGVASGTTDITEGLTGNFTISSGTATQSITPVADTTTEGGETMVMTVKGQTVSIDINDTSLDFNTKSIDFDGGNDYMITNATDHVDGSCSFWIKADAGNGLVFGKNDTTWYFYLQGNYVKWRQQLGSSSDLTDDNIDVTDGNWHHIVGTATTNGSGEDNTVTLYIDGIARKTHSTGEFNNTWTAFSKPLQFGRYIHGILYYNGGLDEVALWSNCLTSDEVVALYNSGSPINLLANSGNYESSANLKHWWRMGDGDTYDTIEDNATNAEYSRLDATMTNMASGDIETDVP